MVRTLICAVSLLLVAPPISASRDVTFDPAARSVEAYDFAEVTVHVAVPDARNPFTDVAVTGEFGKGGAARTAVDGFCDSPHGSAFRIRFLPPSPGESPYSVTYRQGDVEKT